MTQPNEQENLSKRRLNSKKQWLLCWTSNMPLIPLLLPSVFLVKSCMISSGGNLRAHESERHAEGKRACKMDYASHNDRLFSSIWNPARNGGINQKATGSRTSMKMDCNSIWQNRLTMGPTFLTPSPWTLPVFIHDLLMRLGSKTYHRNGYNADLMLWKRWLRSTISSSKICIT